MIDIITYSKKEFEDTKFQDSNIDQYPNDYFICINSTGFVHSIPHFKEDHQRVLNCYFDDSETDTIKYDEIFKVSFEAKALTADQAKDIKNFISGLPGGSTLHIYCTKGKSRSTAVAKFAGKENIENYNGHVYNLLCFT